MRKDGSLEAWKFGRSKQSQWSVSGLNGFCVDLQYFLRDLHVASRSAGKRGGVESMEVKLFVDRIP